MHFYYFWYYKCNGSSKLDPKNNYEEKKKKKRYIVKIETAINNKIKQRTKKGKKLFRVHFYLANQPLNIPTKNNVQTCLTVKMDRF